jgi:toxin FitB
MYLIDTNVISEYRRKEKAHPGVRHFFATTDESALFFPVQVIGEIRAGVEQIRRRGDDRSADRLEIWLELILLHHAERIIEFDLESAQVWGKMLNPRDPNTIDKQIVAIALIRDMTVVTRDDGEAFTKYGAKVLNPFRASIGAEPDFPV